jgi:glycerol-3-phosphate dehydrogenase (NAD(P)+)
LPRLPGIDLPPAIRADSDPQALLNHDMLLLVVPAQCLGSVATLLDPAIAPDATVAICAKGIELASGRLLSAVAAEALPGRTIAVLSGPTFASEIARGLPAAATIACADAARGARLVAALGGSTFRPYLGDDLIGTEVGGALKNVLAIACGIAIGSGYGENARAALITRGLAEVGRLSAALGGRPETLMGLSGVGDVTLSCTSRQSRNFAIGVAIAEAGDAATAMAKSEALTEGVPTARAVTALAARRGVDMPIAAAVDAVLHDGADIAETVGALLARPFKDERTAAAISPEAGR